MEREEGIIAVTGLIGRGRHRVHPWAALGLLLLGTAIAGCGKDCREAVKLGDFEYSQGNYANAAKRYEQALRDDPKCYNVEAKLKDARDRAAERSGR